MVTAIKVDSEKAYSSETRLTFFCTLICFASLDRMILLESQWMQENASKRMNVNEEWKAEMFTVHWVVQSKRRKLRFLPKDCQ